MILVVWIIQLIIMASFDTRLDILNKLLNASALITSLVITYYWGGIFWLAFPLVVLPIIAGILGGAVKGLRQKSKSDGE